MLSVDVFRYSAQSLAQTLAQNSEFTPLEFSNDIHGIFLNEYLSAIGVITVVVEKAYVDQHFLEDYAGYYAHCFADYSRYCMRLHFFGAQFTKTSFLKLLRGETTPLTEQNLRDTYRGFLVVKPLPQTVIGRTCLSTYPERPRFYPICRSYTVTLFGLTLVVSSLAYQEQDRAAAACASSALWSIFHGTGHLFQHEIPSPFRITSSATSISPPTIEVADSLSPQTRSLPSRGLSMFQMAQAVRNVGLEPYSVKVQNTFILRNTLYSYLRAKIPVLLMLNLQTTDNRSIGKHAVAVTGYRLADQSITDVSTGFVSVGNRIERFYVHDDQVGPFARMGIEPDGRLSTSYGGVGSHVAAPEAVLVPLISSIRISAGTINDLVREIDGFIEQARLAGQLDIESDRLEWDIYLISVQDFKRDILSTNHLTYEHKSQLLIHSFPLYLWRATAMEDEQPVLDLLFDSTDLEQGRILTALVAHKPAFLRQLRTAITSILAFAEPTLSSRLVSTLKNIVSAGQKAI